MLDTQDKLKQLLQQSQFSQALELADNTLASHPDDLDTLYIKAVCLRYLKQHTRAIKTINHILAIKPNHGRAHQEAGYNHLALGDKTTAEQGFYFATISNPALISAWRKLAELRNDRSIEQKIAQLSALPAPLLGTMDLIHEGKYGLAEQTCRQFLSKDKHNPDGMCLLAEIGIKTKVYDDALFLLETCIELHPQHEPAKRLWIDLLNTLGQHHRAEPLASIIANENEADLQVLNALATSLVGIGKMVEGIALYRSLVVQHPNNSGLQLQLGHALKAQGQLQHAVEHYQQAYTIKPGFGDAYWSLANTKTYLFSDSEINDMLNQVSSMKGNTLDRIQLSFALGKAFEDRQDYRQSFDYYQLGNQLKSETLQYDPDHHSYLIDLQIQHANADLFNQTVSGNNAHSPIFIVGLPRSGSTLLEQILSAHSCVDATMELHNILGMAMKLRGRMTNDAPAYPENLHSLTAQQLTALGDKFIQDTQHYRRGAPMFIDKMPNNFMHIGLIKLILPNAKVIDARREPIACCFSGYKQLFGEGQDFSYNLNHITRYYQDYLRLMDHWHQVLPNFILTVKHEDVIDDLAGQVKRILDFCNLEFEQACVDYHTSKRTIKTPSSEQVRQPIYRSAMAQWKHYAPYLLPLTQAFETEQ